MAPRSAEATLAMRKPITSVGMAPSRAMKSEPGSAASANRTIGRPERTPTSVPDRRRSAWIDKITGGTAKMLSRRPTPASQSRPAATQNSRITLPAAVFLQRVMRGLDPRIHRLCKRLLAKLDGLPGHKRVYARLQRAMPGNDDLFPSRRALEARERFVDLEPARLRLLALLALAFDHVLRRARDAVSVAKLGVDAGDVGCNARHFLLQARFLGGKIDHPLERQRRDLPAHDELHRALRRTRRERDFGEARQAAHDVGPALGSRLRRRRGGDQHHRDLGRMGDVHSRAPRAKGGDEVDDPADLGLGLEVIERALLRPGREREQPLARRAGLRRDLPQLLGDERRERMQQLEDFVTRPGGHPARLVLGAAVADFRHRPGQLEIPVAKNGPYEGRGRARRLLEIVDFYRHSFLSEGLLWLVASS